MEWKTVKLGDVADVKGGKRLPKGVSLISQPNKHPYIRIRDIGASKYLELTQDYEYVDDVTQQSIKRYIVNTNDILLSIVGTIGLVGVVGETLNYANQTENCVKINNLHGIDRDYLYYYLVSSLGQQEIKLGTVGAVQAKLPLKNVQSISIPLPSLEDQHRIAAILSSLDDKIENNNRINRNLEAQAQALFKSWFVDFEPWGRVMPEDWKEGLFVDLINIMPGGTPSTNVETYWKGGTIPFFSPKDAKGVYCFDTEKHITELGLSNCSSRLYEKDTLFITARGTVGKLALAGVPMAMNQSNYALVAKSGVGCHFLYLLAQTIIDILLKKANGAVFSAITTRDFKEPVIIPTASTMMKFESIVSPLFDKIYQNCEENQRLAALRDTLLPKLMRGEIAL